MPADEDYVKQLEETIGKFLKPIEGAPFHIAMRALYGHQVIPLDLKDEKDVRLIEDLSHVARISGENADRKGIFRNRPNEVGNDIEKLRGTIGDTDSEVVRNIVISYLSEKSYIKEETFNRNKS